MEERDWSSYSKPLRKAALMKMTVDLKILVMSNELFFEKMCAAVWESETARSGRRI